VSVKNNKVATAAAMIWRCMGFPSMDGTSDLSCHAGQTSGRPTVSTGRR
jgi:hypothetical protein